MNEKTERTMPSLDYWSIKESEMRSLQTEIAGRDRAERAIDSAWDCKKTIVQSRFWNQGKRQRQGKTCSTLINFLWQEGEGKRIKETEFLRKLTRKGKKNVGNEKGGANSYADEQWKKRKLLNPEHDTRKGCFVSFHRTIVQIKHTRYHRVHIQVEDGLVSSGIAELVTVERLGLQCHIYIKATFTWSNYCDFLDEVN